MTRPRHETSALGSLASLGLALSLAGLGCERAPPGEAPAGASHAASHALSHTLASASPSSATSATSPAAPSAARALGPLVWAPTRELVTRPELVAKVEALAALPVVSGETVGRERAPSADYAVFRAVRDAASPTELATLVRHERPVVRAYVARALALEADGALVVARLLADDTRVEVAAGCEIGGETLRDVVHAALCSSPHGAAGLALLEHAASLPHGGASSLACASRTQPERASQAAAARLARGLADPDADTAVLLDVLSHGPPLGASGKGALGSACESVRARASSASAEVRRAVARALVRCHEAVGVATLEALTSDADAAVVRAAEASLVLHPLAPEARRRALFDGRAWAASDAAERLAARARALRHEEPELLARVEAMALFGPAELGPAVAALFDTPGSLELARRLVERLPLPRATYPRSVRTAALKRLARAGDAADRPALRRALHGDDVLELEVALGALGAAHDAESRTAIERLTRSSEPRVAAAALAALRTRAR